MNTSKHTPGPLKAVQVIIENSPCTWAVQRKNIKEQWGKPSIATYIDNEADAKLFAAAPAMYEALQRLFNGNVDCGTYWQIDVSDIQAAKQALAQAEGK